MRMKRSLLVKAGEALAPDAFNLVLDSESSTKGLYITPAVSLLLFVRCPAVFISIFSHFTFQYKCSDMIHLLMNGSSVNSNIYKALYCYLIKSQK